MIRTRKIRFKNNFKNCYFSSQTSQKNFDIAVIGGGPVGSTMATLLRTDPLTSHLKVLLVEKTRRELKEKTIFKQENPLDLRSYTLNAFSKSLLEKIGAWPLLKRINPYYKMDIYDAFNRGTLTLNSTPKEIGFLVEDKILAGALEQLDRGQIYYNGEGKTQISRSEDSRISIKHIQKDSRSCFNVKLLIGADGGNSFVRNSIGFPYYKQFYEQRAIISVVKHSTLNSQCFQRFFPNGHVGILPLKPNYSTVIWSTPPNDAERLLELSDSDFLLQLNSILRQSPQDFWPLPATLSSALLEEFLQFAQNSFCDRFLPSRLEKWQMPPLFTEIVSQRGSFPLSVSHVDRYVKNRVALIGDAAHSIHPMTGQGLNMGLKDCFVLHESLKEGVENGYSIGDEMVLRTYETKAKENNNAMVRGSDFLYRLLSCDGAIFSQFRNIGMSAVNHSDFLKQKIIDLAKGGGTY